MFVVPGRGECEKSQDTETRTLCSGIFQEVFARAVSLVLCVWSFLDRDFVIFLQRKNIF